MFYYFKAVTGFNLKYLVAFCQQFYIVHTTSLNFKNVPNFVVKIKKNLCHSRSRSRSRDEFAMIGEVRICIEVRQALGKCF